MVHLNLYKQFAKKENSTKQPDNTTLTLGLQGILKEPCSIMTPVIKIERLALDATPFDYTYAKWVEEDRYFFITDWVWADGLWEVHMKEDVLATFKTEIGATTEYVLRTDSYTNFNGDITDTTYPSTTDIDTRVFQNASPFTPDSISSGSYIIGVISGNDTSAVGAISYYLMSSTEFGNLKKYLFSNENMVTMGIISNALNPVQLVTDISYEVLKTLYNPYQYIASCVWFPIDKDDIVNKTSVSIIQLGWWPYNLSGYLLTATTVNIEEVNISLPSHPQAPTRGNFLNYAPYTRRCLYGKFGSLPLDCAMIKDGDELQISYRVDLITGECRATFRRIRTFATDFLNQKDFMLGVPIQLAQVGTDYLGTMATEISAGAIAMQQAYTLNFGHAIATAANGIYDSIKSQMPQLETSGANGSFLQASNPTKMITQFYQIVDEDIHHRGRPLCELRQLNTLSGFILCAEGEIDISCFDGERKAIFDYLTTGFFWE